MAAISQTVGRPGDALTQLGRVAYSRGELARAEELIERGLAIRRQLGRTRLIGHSLTLLGRLAVSQRDYAAAYTHFAESFRFEYEAGDVEGSIWPLAFLGQLERGQGHLARSQT